MPPEQTLSVPILVVAQSAGDTAEELRKSSRVQRRIRELSVELESIANVLKGIHSSRLYDGSPTVTDFVKHVEAVNILIEQIRDWMQVFSSSSRLTTNALVFVHGRKVLRLKAEFQRIEERLKSDIQTLTLLVN
ncbi:hypothetical protein BT63DRAFT_288365 [Microthyrium microscopicum]|uniref:Uncharacterized protein n=1 Tax=Microthyrium microscopicum TaxID=703497 RepID=A0A6A6U8N6_9PEZI|nr:hypothetical protein BT63DRAFT_288365 [Microthyrium microscopicum]